jgi:hypothetical protein
MLGRVLMFLVGLIYLGAAISWLFDKKWAWATLAICWGIGNLVLAWLAKE